MFKKYALLLGTTALLVTGLVTVMPGLVKGATEVTLYEVSSGAVDDTVSCTGRVESADSREVLAGFPCVVGEVFVQAGDSIKKGDALFSVDVEATKAVFAPAGNASAAGTGGEGIQSVVKSPADGVISSVDASRGSSLTLNQVCAVISSGDILQVKIAIHENRVKNIKIGQSALISGAAFAEQGYEGTVTYIAPTARQQYSGSANETVIDAIITLSEIDESLKPGLTAKAAIRLDENVERIVVPYEYVRQDDTNAEYVYVYKNGRAVKHIIQTGKELSSGLEILSGLEPGDRIIVNADDIPAPDARVSVRTARSEE